MEDNNVAVYVVLDGDSVLAVFDNLDEAERMTNGYYDAVVEGPFTLVKSFDNNYQ